MEKKHMKMAILRQEHTFRQQVHELHRVYKVQKQLMKDMQVVKMNPAQARKDTQTKPWLDTDQQQYDVNSDKKKAPFIEDFDLELTLATGSDKTKQEMIFNSESGATLSSSTSAESESGQQFPDSSVNLSFQNESNRHDDQLMQSPWLYQCLSLKMA
ncbi:uncharacterized protein LOC124654295 [Lolium rigidum]|uniref:uncharacterized protein LOC124654295 n=1 Tax=Lolium rigidum TaxID=89674 RepID=UPI001F5C3114|nr:uncharacterized protein LOC124654295 [Lolium rigidum]XP_047049266.1 uncharacterized protein LOC124654295 [Lolium rigidum]